MIKWTPEEIEYFVTEYKKLNTPLVWDALFVQYGYRNQILRKEVKPVLRDMQVCGPVLTVQGTSKYTPMEEEFDKSGPGPLGGMWTRVAERITPHCVVAIDTGYTEVAVIGDIFGITWKYAGMDGLVVDGPVRDSFGYIEDNVPLFCTHTMPICAEEHWKITDIDVPIWLHGQLGEVKVCPGDFIFGDADGVLVIPNEMVKKVLENAKERAENEAKTKAQIRAGKTAMELYAAEGHGGIMDEEQ